MASRFVPEGQELVFKPDGSVVRTDPSTSSIPVGTAEDITNQTYYKPSTQLKDGKSNQVPTSKNTTAAFVKNLPALVPNPMEQFASMNVLWTMACLTPQQYNNPESYRNSPADLTNIIFSSGGRFDSQRVKTFYGTPEYYINNFVMNTLIGSNEKTGNSNAIKFSFDIIEPHSMGLLLQSMQIAASNAGYDSYLNITPYVLRMDIQGYDDRGIELTVIKPKFFVVKLTKTSLTVNESGSVYKVEAIPLNHTGFSDVINTSYSDVKLFGETVYEMLASGPGSLVAHLNANEAKLVAEKKINVPDEYVIQFPIQASDWKSSAATNNTDNKATVDLDAVPDSTNRAVLAAITTRSNTPSNSVSQPQGDQNVIAAGSMGFGQQIGAGGSPLFKRAGDTFDEATGVLKRDGMVIDPKTRAFQFGQAQTLTQIINRVIVSSDWAKKAIEPNKLLPAGYIQWYKLDVQIEMLDFDKSTGDYAKRIIYRVVPYLTHQSIFTNASSAPIGYQELMKSVVKEYQYIYSGQNVDVLSLAIEINNMFYNPTDPKAQHESAKTANQDQKNAEVANTTYKTGEGPATSVQSAQAGRARTLRDPNALAGPKGGSDDKSSEQIVAENFQRLFITGSSQDMVTVTLEILGDPYWLVDSGSANYFAKAASPLSQITNDGTMNYESGNIYVYISFRTPADINTTTGLYDFSIAGKESPFGGLYRVNMCENTFADGMWKQKLKLLRMPGPQGPEINETVTGETTAPISKETSPALQKDGPAEKSNSLNAKGSGNGQRNAADPRRSDAAVANNGAASSSANTTDSLRNSSRRAAKTAADKKATTTTSNQAPVIVGFKYYRDLGQK
jgi:hypothetical protein